MLFFLKDVLRTSLLTIILQIFDYKRIFERAFDKMEKYGERKHLLFAIIK
ncbi:hypothetical protein HMPREF0557_02282 [Listeria innocua ATCC 33091]|uniref:Uncharacterized protein n=1 Tax=Listeria innocua ATCC 33091 TaxID=1002366 RepID=A0AB72Z797_LISIO|nr:hypothetical protein HMPREF0557_02282 [Listeria innocua ATCC 33091]